MMNIADKIKNIKILDRFELDNKKIILIVLASVTLFYLDFNFIFKAQTKWLSKTSAEVVRLKKDLSNLENESRKIMDLKAKEAASPHKQAQKPKKIITENQIPSLLQDISKAANNNEVAILQIKPFRGQADTVKLGARFSQLLIALELSCGYHNLGKFINELENLQTFVGVQDIKIEPREDNYLKQKVTLTLSTYVKK